MNLYIDISNKRLLLSPTSTMAASTPVFTRGDNDSITIKLFTFENGVLTARPYQNGESLNIGIGKTNGGKSIYALSRIESLGSGESTNVSLNLNTESLSEILYGKESIKALLEIELCGTNNSIATIVQTECIIKNDVIYTDEIPANLPSIAAIQEEILELRNLLQKVLNPSGAVYDKAGNLLNEKIVWQTVKISEDTYSQKWTKVQQ